MSDPIRAELEALIAAYDEHGGMWPDEDVQALFAAVQRARAALAAEPTFIASEPSDEDLADLAEVYNGDPIPAMRRALELWGRPAISALAAEPPEPAEPDTDAVLTLAAIIRESAGNGLPGAARLAELILSHPKVANVFQPPAPAPAADAEERDHVPGAGNMVPAAYAARLRQCPTHGQLPANAWGCPECLRELREELARLRGSTPPADGEAEELAQWLRVAAGDEGSFSYTRLNRAAALLREARPQPVPVAERPLGPAEVVRCRRQMLGKVCQ